MSTAELYGPDFFVGRSQTARLSAEAVVPIVCDVFPPKSVLDVGCGQGEWMEVFARYSPQVFGVDIAARDGPQYLRHDLTKRLNLGRRFDLVVSLEVGEHLPEDAAKRYVSSLVRHGDTVLFSAAVVGQEGKGHINCQPHEYWHEMFEAAGYEVFDPIRPRIANDHRVSPWYRNNLFMYQRAL